MSTLLWYGPPELAISLFDRLDLIESGTVDDPAVGAWIRVARSWRALHAGDHAAAMLLDAAAEDCFTAVGDFRHACMQRANVGYGELMLGAFARAERSMREAIVGATRIGLHQITSQAHHNLGLVLARQGQLDEAREVETQALDAFVAHDNRRLAAAAHSYLSIIETLAGNYAVAIEHAQHAIDEATDKSSTLCTYHGTLAQALRLSGDIDGALETATTAIQMIERHGPPEEGESTVRLAYAEALHAAGKLDQARRAIGEAAQQVRDAAAKIKNANWRTSYLQDVVEHAQILAREADWA
jgi:tetratricopeptide (TPR) repeat protein